MIITNSRGDVRIELGGLDVWQALKSTVSIRLSDMYNAISEALRFLKTGRCESVKCLQVARQINLIRDKLASLPVDDVVYDADDIMRKGPWDGNISPVITSCGNFFTTGDGKDLLAELVYILGYSAYIGADVVIK